MRWSRAPSTAATSRSVSRRSSRQLRKEPGAILFIDEIHTVIGAGAASGGVMDASNLIKPVLASGELRCIGSTTYQEYRGIFEKDRALARRFQKIDVVEPTVEETVADPAGSEVALRGAPWRHVLAQGAAGRGRTGGTPYQRPPPARQGHRRDRRGRRQPAPEAAVASARRPSASREIEDIVAKMARIPPKTSRPPTRTRCARWSAISSWSCSVRTRPSRRWRGAIKMSRSGLGNEAEAGRQLPVRRTDRRRQDRSHAPAGADHWASSSSASTCPNTWSATPCRG